RRLRAAEETAVLRLPPRVDDHRLSLADDVVVPTPDFWLDRLAYRRHVLEVVVVLGRLLGTGLPEHPNRRRRGVKDVDRQSLRDSPRPPGIRKDRNTFVNDGGRGQRQGPVNDVGVTGDPTDVGHAPVGVLGVNVLYVFRGPGDVGEISAGSML